MLIKYVIYKEDNKMEINSVALGEIVYCNLIIVHKKRKYELEKVVYKNNGNLFYNKRLLTEFKIKEPVEIQSIDIMSRLGFESKIHNRI